MLLKTIVLLSFTFATNIILAAAAECPETLSMVITLKLKLPITLGTVALAKGEHKIAGDIALKRTSEKRCLYDFSPSVSQASGTVTALSPGEVSVVSKHGEWENLYAMFETLHLKTKIGEMDDTILHFNGTAHAKIEKEKPYQLVGRTNVTLQQD